MPRAAIRRPLTVTSWLLMSTSACCSSPLLAGTAWLWSTVTGRPQALIFTRLVIRYFALELATLVACGALWLASGAGLLMGTHRAAAALRAAAVVRARVRQPMVRAAGDRARAGRPPEQAARALESTRPLLLFSRHAGPGDTIVLLDQLLTRFHRQPSVVFKQTIVLDPCVDLIGHRLPHAILDTAEPEGARPGSRRSRPGCATGRAAAVSRGRQLHRRAPPAGDRQAAAQGDAPRGGPGRADGPRAAAAARGALAALRGNPRPT